MVEGIMKYQVFSKSVITTVAIASFAWAQSSPGEQRPAESGDSSKMALATQAPSPPSPAIRTDRLHDGFFLRVSLGFASQSLAIDDTSTRPNYTGKGNTLTVDVMLGGSPSPGINLGGALLFDSMSSTRLTSGGDAAKTGLSLLTVGPMIDGYPSPRCGFHSGGMLGVSAAQLTNRSAFATDAVYGFGLAAWLGYDTWVADQWSVGGVLRFAGAEMGRTSTPHLGADARSVALLLTAVYQ
jgi:hypothetical protein